MHYVPELHLEQFLARVSCEGLAGWVYIDKPVIPIDGNGSSRGFCHGAKLCFAFARSLLRLHARADVMHDAEQALTAVIVDHAAIDFHAQGSSGSSAVCVYPADAAASFCNPLLHKVAVFRQVQIQRTHAKKFVAGVTILAQGSLIAVNKMARLAVNHKNSIGDLVEQRMVEQFRFALGPKGRRIGSGDCDVGIWLRSTPRIRHQDS